MDFSLSDEQIAFRDTIRRFVDETVTPAVPALEAEPRFPRELFAEVGKLGVFGLRHSAADGGLDGDLVTASIVLEELARGHLSLAAASMMQMLMATYFLARHGCERIRVDHLRPAIKGEQLGGICMTEPNAGSDLASIETTYRPDPEASTSESGEPGAYRLRGAKTWVTNGADADFFTVLAAPAPELAKERGYGRGQGFNLFFVPRHAPGLTVSRAIHKSSVTCLPSVELGLDDVPVAVDDRLCPDGGGMAALQELLVDIRTLTGALGLGVGRAALEAATKYANERVAFGKPIKSHQLVKAHIAEMGTALEAATWLVRRSAWLSDQGRPSVTDASMAKLAATEAAAAAADACTRVFGGYGIATEYPAERLFRDARFLLFGGGTSEILKLVIAKGLGA